MGERNRFLSTLLALSLVLFVPAGVQASGLSAVELAPITHRSASLSLVLPDGSTVSYSPAELEALPTYELTTRTPWREEEATFQGVLLRDLLALHGLDTLPEISVRAENDFTITMAREVWEAEDFLIATRVDGRAHNRRARGPIQFVLEWNAYQSSELATESHLVWMAAEISPVQ